MTDERLFDVAQAAKRWNVTTKTIYEWLWAGKLKALRTPTGQWRIPESSLPHASDASTSLHNR